LNKIGDLTNLYLDEQLIMSSDDKLFDPLWLPSGNYKLTLRSRDPNDNGTKFLYIAFISGVEYNVPE
jgi:hypothetical protein